MVKLWHWGLIALLIMHAAGCVRPGRLEPVRVPGHVFAHTYPASLRDDMSPASLLAAARASQRYFEVANVAGQRYRLGRDSYDGYQLAASIDYLIELIEKTDPAWLPTRLAGECRSYAPREARFTAYYEPLLEARRLRDERYRFPIYRAPDQAMLASLAGGAAEGIGGDEMVDDGDQGSGAAAEPPRHPTRKEIDGDGVLAGRGLEIAWVDDPVALYFLHIQGSGRLRLDDGAELRLSYADSNDEQYYSIGRYMLDTGILGPGQGSSGAIRAYLSAHPEQREAILFRNPRYIFFREVEVPASQGPLGALGVPLVAGRSLATDRSHVPPGVLTYIVTDAPKLGADGELSGRRPLRRFAFSHDAGAAIEGPGRVDIYWGAGERVGLEAGYMNRPGSLYILICGVNPTPA